MAEDEGAKTGSDRSDAPSRKPGDVPSPHPTGRSGVEPSATEWTASDARGPLAAAHENPEDPAHVENFGSAEPTDTVTRSQPEAERAASEPIPGSEPETASAASAAPAETTRVDPAADPPVAEARPSPWPIAAALLAGAAIGAVVGVVFYRSEANGPDPQVATLSAKVAALEARAPEKPDLDPLQAQLADLRAKVSDAQKTAAAAKTGDDTSALEQKLGTLEQSVTALQKQGADTKDVDARLATVASGLDSVKQQAATTAGDLQAVKDEQKSLAGKVSAPALAVVADSLVQAIDAGQPYARQVDALQALGADPAKLAILRQNAQAGVASTRALVLKLAPLEEPMLATAYKPPPNAGFMQKLESGVSSLVTIRRTTDVSGTDTSSRIARIKADLVHDDLADASATWEALPADAKAKSADWGALVETSAAALGAAHGLQSDAIVALGGKAP